MDVRGLQCRVKELRYDVKSGIGKLVMADGDACSMSACIELFEGIDPQVQTIRTYSGPSPDTSYHRDNDKPGGWVAKVPWTATKAAA